MKFCPECAAHIVQEDRDGHARYVCSNDACSFVNWNNPTPVVAAIILYQGQALLVHNIEWPPKMLGLVTGFLEAKEHPDVAIKREVKEETNLDARAIRFLGHYPFEASNQLIMAYEVECEGEIALNEELDGFTLLDIEKLKPWPLGTGPAVRDWLAARSL